MVEGSRKVLWLPEGKCRTASMREDYVKELARYNFNVLIQQICTKYVQTWMDANRHVQVDAYGPDDKDGRGRECSVKGWCGDDDSCLLASCMLNIIPNAYLLKTMLSFGKPIYLIPIQYGMNHIFRTRFCQSTNFY